jgi:hypothetical protein
MKNRINFISNATIFSFVLFFLVMTVFHNKGMTNATCDQCYDEWQFSICYEDYDCNTYYVFKDCCDYPGQGSYYDKECEDVLDYAQEYREGFCYEHTFCNHFGTGTERKYCQYGYLDGHASQSHLYSRCQTKGICI